MPNLSEKQFELELNSRWNDLSAKDRSMYEQLGDEARTRTRYRQIDQSRGAPDSMAANTDRSMDPSSSRLGVQGDAEMYPGGGYRNQSQMQRGSANNKITISVNVDRNRGNKTPVEENKGGNKRERRSKKFYDHGHKPQFRPESEDPQLVQMPSNDPMMEPRHSGFSMNNRFGIEDRTPTLRKQEDSFNFAFNDDEQNNVFMKNESPDGEFVTPFGRMQGENDQGFQDDPRASSKDISVSISFLLINSLIMCCYSQTI